MKEIGRRLEQFREKFGITQKDMEAKLGYHSNGTIISNIEKGSRKLCSKDLISLKTKYNLNPNWLLTGEGEQKYYDQKEHELITLILDYREYGGEVNYVIEKILTKILDKFYAKEYYFFIIPKFKYGNRLHYVLMGILQTSEFEGGEKDSKNYFRDLIEKFELDYCCLKEIKKELYSMLENLDERDCNYILKHTDTTISLILQRISRLDQRLNGFFFKNEHVSNFI